jgi:hypothetical protein
MDRHEVFLCMKDLLEHLADSCEQWLEADGRTAQYLVDSIQRDLDEFRRVCEWARREASRAGWRESAAA